MAYGLLAYVPMFQLYAISYQPYAISVFFQQPARLRLGRYGLTLPFFVYNMPRASGYRNEENLCIESFSV